MAHVVSECSRLAQTEYKGRHDNVARYIHWQLRGKCEFERENFKILWDFTIQCDRKIQERRPDIVFMLIRRRERLS